jgi:hypothetical protein
MLKATLEKQGTAAALDQLERLAAADSAILGDGHPLAHALGRFSFTHYGSASKAFSQCKELFQSGCYHGVLEAYFIANPDFTGQDVAGLCSTLVTGNQTTFVKFQCVHGLGHGLTMYFEHDIFDALKYCDYLPTTWDRESCYGGVFMENIVFYQTKDSGAHGDHAHHETFLDPADPLYPCNAVGQRYLYQCYLMQTSAILTFNGYDFAKAFTTCAKVEQAFIPICYQSLGRDISGYTLRDTDKSLFLCALDKGEYMKHCIVGVVKNFIDVTWTTDQAYDFCRKAAEETKEACYTAIGEQLLGLQPDPGARAADCAKSEERYLNACRAAARV